jgi:hypothetical protein
MALGFESVGTSKKLNCIMYHGLFHRDFPELWKLHDNKDLREKAVYVLSLQRLQTGITLNSATVTISGVIDDSCLWLEFPPVKQLLFDCICTNYQLLVLTKTSQRQHKLYAKFISDLHVVIQANGYSVAESVNDQVVMKHLRVYFKSQFQKARKLLEAMKSAESRNQKHALQSLIGYAESIDFANPKPELFSATRMESEKKFHQKGKLAHTEMVDKDDASLPTIGANTVIPPQDLDSSHAQCDFLDDTLPSQSTCRKRSASSGPQKSRCRLNRKGKADLRNSKGAGLSIVASGSHAIDVPSPENASRIITPAKQTVAVVSNNFEQSVLEGLAPQNAVPLRPVRQTLPLNVPKENCLPCCMLDGASEPLRHKKSRVCVNS